MSEAKLNFYGNYHKAIRRALFELAARAGLLDYEHDETAIARLTDEFTRLTRALREHSTYEDAYMQPLLVKYAPEVAEYMERQHASLDPVLDVLDEQLRNVDSAKDRNAAGLAFYAALNRWIAGYLEHLADEEDVANPALWERCPHEELADAIGQFRKSLALEQVASSFEFMLPALSPPERADLYLTVRDNAPKPVFETLMEVAEKALSANDYEDLKQRL